MYEIISGNIAVGVKYQVIGTGAINYNSNTYLVNTFFIGVLGITTYTTSSGVPLVIEASTFLGFAAAQENDFYLGLFSDESRFTGLSISVQEIPKVVDGGSEVDITKEFITFSIGLEKDAYVKASIKELFTDEASATLTLVQVDNTLIQYLYYKVMQPVSGLPFTSLESLRIFLLDNLILT